MLVARAQQMALRGDKLFFIIISLSVLGTITTLSSDVNNGTPTHRKRRAMVFPSGTVLQVRLNMSFCEFYQLSIPNKTFSLHVIPKCLSASTCLVSKLHLELRFKT
jgi:hypothetical protein